MTYFPPSAALDTSNFATKTELTSGLNGKANSSTVGGLSTAVASKAAQSDLDALATSVSDKASAASVTALSGTVAGKAAASDLTALAATVPAPAGTMPPGVADSGALGTAVKYAREDHTHASKARKEIKAISADGVITWTFPTAFAAGVVPICNGMAICPTGTTDIVNVQQEGDATNTQVKFRVARYQRALVSLIGLTILSAVSGLPTNTKLSLLALEP